MQLSARFGHEDMDGIFHFHEDNKRFSCCQFWNVDEQWCTDWEPSFLTCLSQARMLLFFLLSLFNCG
jgi:hypothetical protein